MQKIEWLIRRNGEVFTAFDVATGDIEFTDTGRKKQKASMSGIRS